MRISTKSTNNQIALKIVRLKADLKQDEIFTISTVQIKCGASYSQSEYIVAEMLHLGLAVQDGDVYKLTADNS
jgi:hypothetical protein